MNRDHDSDLRDRFAQLRRDDEAGAPAFRATLDRGAARARRRPAGPRPATVALGAAAVLAAIALGGLLFRPSRAPVELDLAATKWRGPTDFLLQLPGDDALRTVPRLGESAFEWRTP